MSKVKDIIKAKGNAPAVFAVEPNEIVYRAIELMAEKNIGAVLVFENEKLVGVFSERDYARKVILKGKSSKDTNVSELMTQDVFYVKPENTLDECMALMTSKHIRHLPVFDNKQIKGIITIGDVVKEVISEQEIMIKDLEDSIDL